MRAATMMLRWSLVALSTALVVPVLHASVFQGDELTSLLLFGLPPLRALALLVALVGSLLYALLSPCSRRHFNIGGYAISLAILGAVLSALKLHLDTNLLTEFSVAQLSPETHDFGGKVVLVTGANSGVGLGVAKAMARLGATVVMGCRSAAKCSRAAAEVEGGQTDPLALDLASFASVHAFADAFLERHDRLDVAFFNAGFAAAPRNGATLTQEGFELGLGTMHFGHFLLFQRLRNTLLRTASGSAAHARVVMTSSAASQLPFARFDESLFEDQGSGDLRGELTTVSMQYPRSKLANVLFARRLQQLYPEALTTCSCHVGAVDTSIWSVPGGAWAQSLMDGYTRATMRTIEQGSRTLLKCALSTEPDVLRRGAYLDGMGLAVPNERLHAPSANDTLARRLWEVSEQVVAS